ncbi:hypothetical protein [Cronobacter sakazakii]|uniref:hypothetical protein n=1 Tax=Cronobacter sakazakii TaxID=28141 RepID=UPI000DFFE2ED|nr:hypothetical protein [Cronobacter sakazakii]STD04917.1 Uncharacterised protein [Cronobacter sakazakii]
MNTAKLKAAAMAATPGRIGDRIDGSGSIKYRCIGADGSLVLLTDHKNNEYGFVGDNGEADELFFRLCTPEAVIELIAALEAAQKRNAELEARTVTLPRPACTYADHSYPAYSEKQVVELLESLGINLETGGE